MCTAAGDVSLMHATDICELRDKQPKIWGACTNNNKNTKLATGYNKKKFTLTVAAFI